MKKSLLILAAGLLVPAAYSAEEQQLNVVRAYFQKYQQCLVNFSLPFTPTSGKPVAEYLAMIQELYQQQQTQCAPILAPMAAQEGYKEAVDSLYKLGYYQFMQAANKQVLQYQTQQQSK